MKIRDLNLELLRLIAMYMISVGICIVNSIMGCSVRGDVNMLITECCRVVFSPKSS